MAHKHPRPRPHAEVRHRSQMPLPAVDEVEQRLEALLSPSLLAPRQLERRDPRQPQRRIRTRQRLLTLPVMVAILVSLGWRRVPSLAEVQQVLAREGVWGRVPLRGSSQALPKRLGVRPAAVMGQRCGEVCTRLHAQTPPTRPPPRWAPEQDHGSRLALVDGLVHRGPGADVCDLDLLCRPADDLPAGRVGLGRTPGADRGGEGVAGL
jgi:hypothetical protein